MDVVLFTIHEEALKVLLVRRKNSPFKGKWALPGGFVEMEESLETAALRELKEETGVANVYLEQLYTFGEPRRDPRTRVIAVAYFALINLARVKIKAGSDAAAAAWHSAFRPPVLAFDHANSLKVSVQRLRAKLGYSTVGFQLLPKKFTLAELQKVYEVILRKKIDKRNFRKKILGLDLLKSHPEQRKTGAHRPAQLHSFKLNRMMILDGQII